MFIERLTKEDVAEFLNKKYAGIVTKIPDLYDFDNPISFKQGDNSLAFETEYKYYMFKDFEYTVIDKYKKCKRGNVVDARIDRDWLDFMYNKFGNEYKKAYLEYREAKKMTELKRIEKMYDEETKKIKGEIFD